MNLRIKQVCKEKKITQKELAKKAFCTEATISRYIHKGKEPGAFMLYRISKVLGVTMEELIEGDAE